jgi:hypothetical protein
VDFEKIGHLTKICASRLERNILLGKWRKKKLKDLEILEKDKHWIRDFASHVKDKQSA